MVPPEPDDAGPQAAYAVARARVEVRLQDLRAALDAHEANRANWTRVGDLEAVEARLAEIVEFIRAHSRGRWPSFYGAPVPSNTASIGEWSLSPTLRASWRYSQETARNAAAAKMWSNRLCVSFPFRLRTQE